MSKEIKKKVDILALILFPITATFFSLLFNFNFLLTSIFFFVIPSVYLSFRNKNSIFRNLIFVLPFAAVTGIVADYILVLDNAWFVPTLFPFRILGKVTVEELVWYVSIIYFCIVIYEHFQDRKRHNLTDNHLKKLFFTLTLLFSTFIGIFLTHPLSLQISYFYFLTEIFLIVTIVLIISKYPSLFRHLIKVSIYLIAVSLMNLIVGAKLGNWVYTGSHFIGWAKIYGVLIPFEEIILSLILWLVIIEYFEFFDDRKDLK